MKLTNRIGAFMLALALTLSALSGCGKTDPDASGSSNSSGSSSGDVSQELQGMDLSGVTDPYLALAGMAGDTVVAQLGDQADITAGELLYWLDRTAENYLDYLEQFYGYILEIPWSAEVADGVTVADQLLENALYTAACYRAFQIMADREGLVPDASIPQDAEQEFLQRVEQLGSEDVVTHVLWAQMLTKDLLISLNQTSDLYVQLEQLYYGEDSGGYPTDAEVMAWLDEGGYFRVKHILLMTIDQTTREPLDEETIAQKKATADDLLAQLRAAEDPIALFDTLMQENSEDSGLATNPNGYIFTAQDSLVDGFREATLALNVGDISDVVETDYGYHIMLRLPIDPADYRTDAVTDWMQRRADQLLDDLGLETTDAYAQIDPAALWTNLIALQTTVYQEIEAASSQNDDASSSSQG